eukprot:1394881-Amorphochlora_amoeboformis.AAC.1
MEPFPLNSVRFYISGSSGGAGERRVGDKPTLGSMGRAAKLRIRQNLFFFGRHVDDDGVLGLDCLSHN